MCEATQCACWSNMLQSFYCPVSAEYLCMFVCEMEYLTYLFSADSEAVFRNGCVVKQTDLLHQTASVRHAVLNDCNETAAGITSTSLRPSCKMSCIENINISYVGKWIKRFLCCVACRLLQMICDLSSFSWRRHPSHRTLYLSYRGNRGNTAVTNTLACCLTIVQMETHFMTLLFP